MEIDFYFLNTELDKQKAYSGKKKKKMNFISESNLFYQSLLPVHQQIFY